MKKQSSASSSFILKGMATLALSFTSYAFTVAAPPSSLNGWNMVFNDEFDGNQLDKSKWNPTYNWGHTHNHRAYCVEENVSVSNGKLIIKGEAKRHPQAPATCKSGDKTYSLDYTSGAIDTRGKFEVKYGYIEGRFKMPKQLGTWPAFWTLQDGWPPEIDIFEVPHSRTDHHYYLHYTKTEWYASHGSAWDHEASFGGVHKGPDKSADFHNYGMEWDDKYMRFYFDDKLVASYNRPAELSQTTAQYIIVNLAIGGWAETAETPIQVTANNPAYLECDWIRVWKRNETPVLHTDQIKLMSLETGTCLQPDGHALKLGDCADEASRAQLVDLGGVYRINFGDQVLEVPDESKDAGHRIGLWGWNGKAHQQIGLNKVNDKDGLVVTMQYAHSGWFAQTSNEGLQQNVMPETNAAYWRILQGDELPTSVSAENASSQISAYFNDGRLQFSGLDNVFATYTISVYTINGSCIYRSAMQSQTPFVDISLPSGIYLIGIDNQRTIQRLKLVVE
ncbi:MAG: family 16 glycosylhydrolase [Paludibacteraceae bacterium]|nr:family 16 glycosylhydrolase [Paludibacteraceae bacterium]